jgi:hypothetical protein
VGGARAAGDDLAGAYRRLHGHEMAAPDASFAGKPGDTLATVTPALTRPTSGRPSVRTLRAALYWHAFNLTRARCRDRSGCGRGARLAGAGLAACRPAQRSASRAASSTVPTGLSALSRFRRSWPACSGGTCASTGPRRTAGCSAASTAACSANRSTAASGTPPGRLRSVRNWPPRRSPADPNVG